MESPVCPQCGAVSHSDATCDRCAQKRLSGSTRQTDRNLLLGVLAMQLDFVTSAELISAMYDWGRSRQTPLEDLLQQRGALEQADKDALLAVVRRHIARNEGPGNSLGKLCADSERARNLAEDLHRLEDQEICQSLAFVSKQLRPPHEISTLPDPQQVSSDRRYRILRPHARGGLGQVSVALDQELDREVAFKEIIEGRAADQAHRQRFLFEAQVTGGLEHPGVVPVYGLGAYEDGRPFYAMRFIKGDSLAAAVRHTLEDESIRTDPARRMLERRRLLARFVTVCHTIEYAHSRGVLHRDLKPANIMLGRFGESIVVDWGLAKVTDRADSDIGADETTLRPSSGSDVDATQPGTVIGTPAYMSPEQASGDHELVGVPADVYGLGATLYFLLTGKPPFEQDEIGSVLEHVRAGKFPAPRTVRSDVSLVLDAICLKAMALSPGSRYGSAALMAEDLERALADEPVLAYPEPPTARASRWLRRHRTTVASLLTFLVVATISLSVSVALLSRAYQAESIAKGKALRQTAAAREARSDADDERQRARRAIDNYVEVVQKSEPLRRPAFKPLARELLADALAFYKELIAKQRTDDNRRLNLAATMRRAARIYMFTGGVSEAEEGFREALTVFDDAIERYPASTEARVERAYTLGDLAETLMNTEQLPESAETFAQAAEAWAELAKAQPEQLTFRTFHIRNLHNSHLPLSQAGQQRQAFAMLQRAYVAAKDFKADRGDAREAKFELAHIQTVLADVYGRSGLRQQADELSGEAISVLKDLADKNRDDTQYQRILAQALHNRAVELQSRRGILGEAVALYEQAREILERIDGQGRDPLGHQFLAVKTYAQLAIAYDKLDRDEASEELRQLTLHHCRRMLLENPETARLHESASDAIQRIAILYRDQDDLDTALGLHRELEAILTPHYKRSPKSTFYGNQLAKNHLQIGRLYRMQKDPMAAAAEYRKGIEIYETVLAEHPRLAIGRENLAYLHSNLGNVLSDEKLYTEAEEHSLRAIATVEDLIQLNPGARRYYRTLQATMRYENLAVIYFDSGQTEEYFAQREQALASMEESADRKTFVETCGNFALLLASAKDPRARDGARALTFATRAVELTSEREPRHIATLAAALAEVGQFEQAVAEQKKAIAMSPESERAPMTERLRSYEAGQALNTQKEN